MIVVKVFHWPDKDPANAVEIASADIAKSSSDGERSSYTVLAAEHGSPVTGLGTHSIGGEVCDYVRAQSVWGLVCEAAALAASKMNAPKGRVA